MHCPGGNATDPIWRVLASSDGISSWTPLKPQHSNLSLWPINSGVWTFLLLQHLSSSLTDSQHLLCHSKTDTRFRQDEYISMTFFPTSKQNFIAYRSSKVSSRPDCVFEIHYLWQSGFSRVYSNSCCRCLFEPEIIKIGRSSHNIYSNNILNFQESSTILNACTKKSGNILNVPRIYICCHPQTDFLDVSQLISVVRQLGWQSTFFFRLSESIPVSPRWPNVRSGI